MNKGSITGNMDIRLLFVRLELFYALLEANTASKPADSYKSHEMKEFHTGAKNWGYGAEDIRKVLAVSIILATIYKTKQV